MCVLAAAAGGGGPAGASVGGGGSAGVAIDSDCGGVSSGGSIQTRSSHPAAGGILASLRRLCAAAPKIDLHDPSVLRAVQAEWCTTGPRLHAIFARLARAPQKLSGPERQAVKRTLNEIGAITRTLLEIEFDSRDFVYLHACFDALPKDWLPLRPQLLNFDQDGPDEGATQVEPQTAAVAIAESVSRKLLSKARASAKWTRDELKLLKQKLPIVIAGVIQTQRLKDRCPEGRQPVSPALAAGAAGIIDGALSPGAGAGAGLGNDAGLFRAAAGVVRSNSSSCSSSGGGIGSGGDGSGGDGSGGDGSGGDGSGGDDSGGDGSGGDGSGGDGSGGDGSGGDGRSASAPSPPHWTDELFSSVERLDRLGDSCALSFIEAEWRTTGPLLESVFTRLMRERVAPALSAPESEAVTAVRNMVRELPATLTKWENTSEHKVWMRVVFKELIEQMSRVRPLLRGLHDERAPVPKQRKERKLADPAADPYDQRLLAMARAHGRTKEQIWALHEELFGFPPEDVYEDD